jgi:cysteine-rich repeat protein
MNGQVCRTLTDVQKFVARGGLCTAQNLDGDSCDSTCHSEIPTCNDGLNTCDAAQGENCRTCRPDCACSKGRTCNVSGQCVYQKGGGFCGDGTVQSAEQCDDSNTVSGDGCSSTCTCEACGDGYKCKSEQCDDGNLINGDGCSSTCKIEATCSDGKQNQGETQVDCGGPCPACPCLQAADCNDNLYCTVDRCVSGSCQYTTYNAFTGGANDEPCKTDFPRVCTVTTRCFCNENTNACELCKNTSGQSFVDEAACKAASNTLCQDHGNPNGCYQKSAGSWCCPGRE